MAMKLQGLLARPQLILLAKVYRVALDNDREKNSTGIRLQSYRSASIGTPYSV